MATQQSLFMVGPQLLLDAMSVAPLAAYSTRKLRESYTGPAVQVKRPSDNALLDIGFVNKSLDTAALAAFVGSQTATARFYDQGANAYHTGNLWPDITAAGVVYNINGKPALYFSGNDELNSNMIFSGTTLSALVVMTCSNGARALTAGTFGQQDYNAPNVIILIGGAADGASGAMSNYRNGTNGSSGTVTGGVPFQVYSYYDGTKMGINIDGVVSATVNTSGPISGNKLSIAGNLGSPNEIGKYAEVIIFPNALNTNDLAIARADQKAYWGTP